MKQTDFTIILQETEEGGYIVTCPTLPGLVTEGDTVDEALSMAKEAIAGYIESIEKDGDFILPKVQEHQISITTSSK